MSDSPVHQHITAVLASRSPNPLRSLLENMPAFCGFTSGVFMEDVVFDPASEITRDKLTQEEFEKVIGGKAPDVFRLLSNDTVEENERYKKLCANPALQYKETIIPAEKSAIDANYEAKKEYVRRTYYIPHDNNWWLLNKIFLINFSGFCSKPILPPIIVPILHRNKYDTTTSFGVILPMIRAKGRLYEIQNYEKLTPETIELRVKKTLNELNNYDKMRFDQYYNWVNENNNDSAKRNTDIVMTPIANGTALYNLYDFLLYRAVPFAIGVAVFRRYYTRSKIAK